jgi:histidine triad (HIT) family protein
MEKECIFCGIVSGTAPARIVYQNADVICFLPKDSETYGHTLVVPKKHFVDIYSLPEDLLGTITVAIKKISLHYRDVLGASGVNLLHASGKSAQQSVFHFHIHLLPRFENDGLDLWPRIEPIDWDKDEFLRKIEL